MKAPEGSGAQWDQGEKQTQETELEAVPEIEATSD